MALLVYSLSHLRFFCRHASAILLIWQPIKVHYSYDKGNHIYLQSTERGRETERQTAYPPWTHCIFYDGANFTSGVGLCPSENYHSSSWLLTVMRKKMPFSNCLGFQFSFPNFNCGFQHYLCNFFYMCECVCVYTTNK